MIFVGVHCRRTDYAHHYKVVSGGTLVDHTFFDTAFDIYRRRYNDDMNKVIFLAVSDDNDWIKVLRKYYIICRQLFDFNMICFQDNLSHHPDVMFGTDYSQKRVAKGDLVGWDLCVLATSDHSVHTYGTFGLWGSLLAGGDVVASRGRSDTLTEEDEVNIDNICILYQL